MWQWTQEFPPHDEVHQNVQARDHNFRVQSSSSSSEPQTSVPGEINTSSGVSFNCTNLLTKDNSIRETLRDLGWNSNLGRLTNQTWVPQINSNNRSTCVYNFYT